MDNETTSFQSTQPDPDDDWYEPERATGKVLWGRIIALVVALLVAFLIGRATAGGGSSISASRYAKVKRDLAIAKAQAAQANHTPSAGQTTPGSSPSPQASATDTAAGETTYVVKSGDTLRGIAQKFYGDVSLVDLIAQANNITDPALVHEGTELTIPPKP